MTKAHILPEQWAVVEGPQFQAILLDSAAAHQSRPQCEKRMQGRGSFFVKLVTDCYSVNSK
jgi:hypothetical protein